MSDLFKEKSQEWDKLTIPQQLSQVIGPKMLEHLKPDAKMKVLDFGAGTGLLTSHIAPEVASVAAVDISESMLNRLLEKADLKDKVVCHCQDITQEPLDEQFDLIVSAMAVHHVKDTQALLDTFAAHLNPKGRIALADLDEEDGSFHGAGADGVFHFGFNQDALKEKLQKAGFKEIVFTTIYEVSKMEKRYPIFLVTAQKS